MTKICVGQKRKGTVVGVGQKRKGTVVEAMKAVEATLMKRRSLYLHTTKNDELSII
jgi:hypothetical protein